MVKRTNRSLIWIAGVLVLVLALGVTAVFAQVQEGDDADTDSDSSPTLPFRGGHGGRGFGSQIEGLTPKDELLANALDISVEELQEAQAEARLAAIDQALEDGLITEEQAEQLRQGEFGFRGGRHGFGFHGFGRTADKETLLAEALGIAVADLHAARDEAHAARLAEMVDAGLITEEQAELMMAYQALKGTLDREALLAEALGISMADLQAAREEGKSLSTLIDELGLTQAEVAEAHQAAYEAAVQEAVEDGVLTQEQADQILSSDFGGHGFGRCGGFRGHGGRTGFGGHRGFRGFGPTNSNTTTSGTSI